MLLLVVLGSLFVLGEFVLVRDLVKCTISTVSTVPTVPTNLLGLAGRAVFDSVSLCTCTCFMISASVRISSRTVHILILVWGSLVCHVNLAFLVPDSPILYL